MHDIESIEKRLWSSGDNLRANSNYASNEYLLPVMGLIFLRRAYSRYLAARARLEKQRPTRSGKALPLSKEDFSRKGAIYLRPEARLDYLVGLRDSDDRAAVSGPKLGRRLSSPVDGALGISLRVDRRSRRSRQVSG